MQLISTVTTQRRNQIASEATAVHSNQWRRIGFIVNIAHHQSYRFLSFELDSVDHNVEVTVLGWQLGLSGSCHEFFIDAAVRNDLFDSDDFQTVSVRHFEQLVPCCSIPLAIQNFTKYTCRSQSSHPSQVDGSFGMTRTTQHATLHGYEGINMARFHKIRRLAGIDC